jgi:hypothetical protein
MVRAVRRARPRAVLATLAGACLVLTGCSSMQRPDVEQVAGAFEDAGADPEARCDLLTPATLAAFEEEASAPCAEAIEDVPLEGGDIEAVEIWGGDAQVRLSGDTVFLTETHAGWRVAAASCRSRGEAPYDCEVEGP